MAARRARGSGPTPRPARICRRARTISLTDRIRELTTDPPTGGPRSAFGVGPPAVQPRPRSARQVLIDPVEVWLPDNPARASLGELPESVEINLIPRDG